MAVISKIQPFGSATQYDLQALNDSEGNQISSTYLKRSGGTMLGAITTNGIKGTLDVDYGELLPSTAVEGQLFFQVSDGHATADRLVTTAATTNTNYYIIGAAGAGPMQQPYIATANASGTANTTGVRFNGSTGVLFGAAWNDYAEYRDYGLEEDEEIPYGYVVIENGDDTVSLSTERLQPCGQIVSDCFGFIIGHEESSVPVALCGRVLAYPYEDRNSFQIGDAVCTGPEGKVSKMTREEIIHWPDRIIGYVSSIPTYEIWDEKNIKVNGRIWIKVK